MNERKFDSEFPKDGNVSTDCGLQLQNTFRLGFLKRYIGTYN